MVDDYIIRRLSILGKLMCVYLCRTTLGNTGEDQTLHWAANPMKLRLFSTLKSAAILPLNASKNKLKIYSSLGGGSNGFRLTNGTKVSEAIVIIGANYYKLLTESEASAKEALKLLLKTIRPVPEIVVIGQSQKKNPENWDDLKEEFGCSLEVSESSLTAASTFNTLIDDDRGVIGLFL